MQPLGKEGASIGERLEHTVPRNLSQRKPQVADLLRPSDPNPFKPKAPDPEL